MYNFLFLFYNTKILLCFQTAKLFSTFFSKKSLAEACTIQKVFYIAIYVMVDNKKRDLADSL